MDSKKKFDKIKYFIIIVAMGKEINLNLFDRLLTGRVRGLTKGRKHFCLDNRSYFILNNILAARCRRSAALCYWSR